MPQQDHHIADQTLNPSDIAAPSVPADNAIFAFAPPERDTSAHNDITGAFMHEALISPNEEPEDSEFEQGLEEVEQDFSFFSEKYGFMPLELVVALEFTMS